MVKHLQFLTKLLFVFSLVSRCKASFRMMDIFYGSLSLPIWLWSSSNVISKC